LSITSSVFACYFFHKLNHIHLLKFILYYEGKNVKENFGDLEDFFVEITEFSYGRFIAFSPRIWRKAPQLTLLFHKCQLYPETWLNGDNITVLKHLNQTLSFKKIKKTARRAVFLSKHSFWFT